jgi:hypothetical protein
MYDDLNRHPDMQTFGHSNLDFFERIFQISPDNGSGVTELVCVTAIFAVVLMLAVHRLHRRSKDTASGSISFRR